ncbi:MAG: hypothetical protein JWR10_3103 [Rubritepida sp.]|nr:hypothetical protein [Rubritepida sp.]
MKPAIEAQHPVQPQDRSAKGVHLPAAIRLQDHVAAQHGPQPVDVTSGRGGEEGAGDPLALLALDRIARAGGLHVTASAHGELAHRSGIPVQGRRDLIQRQPKDVVQQEGRSL